MPHAPNMKIFPALASGNGRESRKYLITILLFLTLSKISVEILSKSSN